MLAGSASDISQQVLRTDVAGMPLEWIDYREAVRLYHAEQVAYDCGTLLYSVFGGYSAIDGKRICHQLQCTSHIRLLPGEFGRSVQSEEKV